MHLTLAAMTWQRLESSFAKFEAFVLHHLIVIASNFVKEPVVRLPHMGRCGISLSSCQQTDASFGHFAHFVKGDFTIKQLTMQCNKHAPTKETEAAARVEPLAADAICLVLAVYDWESTGPCLLCLPLR
jgi:hypothetical protein